MEKITSLIIIGMCAFNNATAVEEPVHSLYANEVCKLFINEMEKKYGWKGGKADVYMPCDIQEFKISFTVREKGSVELSRRLAISAIERFREIIHSHEKILPYLRNVPLDITDTQVILVFTDENENPYLDGSVAALGVDCHKHFVYAAARKDILSNLDLYEIHRESYGLAYKKLGITHSLHGPLLKKEESVLKKSMIESYKEWRLFTVSLAEEEEEVAIQYRPGDELKLLGFSGNGFCNSVAEALRERIVGGAENYFDEAFLKKVAEKEKESQSGEYAEYWPNGELKVKVQWKNGKPDGHMHGWYPNAVEAFKAYFKEGVKQGVHMTFLPLEWRFTSQAFARCYSYNEEGKLHGTQMISYCGGPLKASVNYQDGVLDGEVLVWNAFGQAACAWQYKKGKLVPLDAQVSNGVLQVELPENMTPTEYAEAYKKQVELLRQQGYKFYDGKSR